MSRKLHPFASGALSALIFAAGVLSAPAPRAQTILPDSRAAERQLFPVTKSEFVVAAGDTIADRVLGQMDFTHATQNFADASTLDFSRSFAEVAIDQSVTPNRVYVTDAANSRVLAWSNVAALTNGKAADLVIGQPDFFSTSCNNGGASASSLCGPRAIAVDSSGNLYVADTENNRVLEYNTPFANTGVAGSGDAVADEVFGQEGDFSATGCNLGEGTATATSDTLCRPNGVAIDATGVLYITDTGNNRVLMYLFPSIDTTADDLFGQLGHFNRTSCNRGGSSPDADSLCGPGELAIDSFNNLYVADAGNSRVLEYDDPVTNDTTADNVLGQGNSFLTGGCNDVGTGANAKSLCNPAGVALDLAGHVYVADSANNRVLEYTSPAISIAADKVFGQDGSLTGSSCNVNGDTDADGLCRPEGVALDSTGNLYVVDGLNNRVLKYDSAFTGDTTADVVLGQPNFSANNPNIVDASDFGGSAGEVTLVGTVNFTALGGVAFDNHLNRLYVADTTNNRVLGYNDASSFANGAPANVVIGQQNFVTGSSPACNGNGASLFDLCRPIGVAVDGLGNLYVADYGDNRVLKFAAPVVTGELPALVIGQANFFSQNCNALPGAEGLCEPTGLAVDIFGNLYVADTGNNRVLEFTTPESTNPSASRVFGQPGFTTTDCNHGGLGPASLCSPTGVTIDGSGHMLIADLYNNRVLLFKTPFTKSSADFVFGQGGSGTNFDSQICNLSGLGSTTLCGPVEVALDENDNPYVSDALNNRIVHYTPNATKAVADMVFGQGGLYVTNKANLGGTTPSAATLSLPLWLATDAKGNLYAADGGNNRVLQYEDPAGSPSPTPTPGMATVSPSELLFGNVATGNTSPVKTATLTNNGAGTIVINAINRVGSNPTDFVQNNNCIGSLAGGKSCTIKVMFTPSAAVGTPEAVQFVIYDNSKNGPQLLEAYGTSAPPATLAPSSLNFGNVTKGTTSASKTVTLTNNLNRLLTISSISVTGTNPGDFPKTTTCGSTLAAFANCTVSVSFKPAATGARSATLAISDSPDSGSPHHVALTGTGQ